MTVGRMPICWWNRDRAGKGRLSRRFVVFAAKEAKAEKIIDSYLARLNAKKEMMAVILKRVTRMLHGKEAGKSR